MRYSESMGSDHMRNCVYDPYIDLGTIVQNHTDFPQNWYLGYSSVIGPTIGGTNEKD